jgi:hypothetical protein
VDWDGLAWADQLCPCSLSLTAPLSPLSCSPLYRSSILSLPLPPLTSQAHSAPDGYSHAQRGGCPLAAAYPDAHWSAVVHPVSLTLGAAYEPDGGSVAVPDGVAYQPDVRAVASAVASPDGHAHCEADGHSVWLAVADADGGAHGSDDVPAELPAHSGA